MSTKPKVIVKRIIAVLKFPRRINDFANYAGSIYKAMNGNASFPNAAPRLAQLNTDLAKLLADEQGTKTKPPTISADARNADLAKLKQDLYQLRDLDVQAAANANPPNAEAIITSSAMGVKKSALRQARQDGYKQGKISGSATLTAKGSGPHQWQQSPDGGVTTVDLDPTGTGTKIVIGFAAGAKMWFRNRQILRKGKYGGWSQWILVVFV